MEPEQINLFLDTERESEKESLKLSRGPELSGENLPTRYVEGYLEDLEGRPSFSVEGNFMFLPIFSFDRHSANRRSKVTHSVPILKNGTVTTNTLSISTAEILDDGESVNPGLPGAFDMQVLFCLMDLWDEQGRPEDGVVRFRLTTISRRLNISISGKTFSELRFSIKKLAVTKLESVSAFFNQERATYTNALVSILENPEFVSHKSSAGSAEQCQVKLSSYILKNLIKNYRGQINRKLYQSLGNGFAQRLFSLYQYRVQFHHERKYVDFELMELASILPMSGKLYPSKVKERLTISLAELLANKVLKHDFIKVGNRTVLRLTSFDLEKDVMVGEQAIQNFLALCQSVYNLDPLKYFDISREVFQKLVARYSTVISFDGNDYSWAFHVFDVALFMITKQSYKIDNRSSWIKTLLDKKALDYPISYRPLDIQYEESVAKEEVKVTIAIKEASEQNAEDELFRIAMGFARKLTPESYERYSLRARERNPLLKEVTAQLDIADLLVEDMKNGIDINPMLRRDAFNESPTKLVQGPGQTGIDHPR